MCCNNPEHIPDSLMKTPMQKQKHSKQNTI